MAQVITNIKSRIRAESTNGNQRTQQVQQFFEFTESPTLPSLTSPKESPCCQFANRFAALLQSDPKAVFKNSDVNELARQVFGSSAGHSRDAYDAVEAGFNLYLRNADISLSDTSTALTTVLNEQARLPRQSKRDQKQVELQQFSTPPALALLATAAAALKEGMSVLEPSAGTGNLATFAALYGATVDTNEIDPRRLELLTLQEFKPTNHDAERLNNLLDGSKLFDAIVMNPPFSATGGRVRGHSTAFGARHIDQALLRLKPGGRLSAIVGRGMALERPTFSDWWATKAKNFRIRANVGIDGKHYGKFGTTFDVQLIVLDKDGNTTDLSNVITGSELSPHEAYKLLEPLCTEDVLTRIRKDFRNSGTNSFRLNGTSNSNGKVSTSHSKNGRRTKKTSLFDLEPSLPPAPSKTYDSSVGKLDKSVEAQLVNIEEGTVFAAYRVQKAVVKGSHPHPATVVESTAMACVEPPDVSYQHHLPAELIAEGRVSDLQIEDVIYAGQATSSLLPDGSRKGHWNGDGTGIGKGRELYAFIYNELEQGRTKHVHISASHQLCKDAERDRDAIGLPLPIIHQARLKPADRIEQDAGVVFTTYSMLATNFGGDRPRFKQLTDWLGEDFAGVIAFDEAHLMKNAAATPFGGRATVDHGTLRGNMGITLQREFPSARVRYFSATGATEARHMAPYERLGLWGPGAPFPDFQAFLIAMEQGGVAAMEMLCRDLKSVGTYLSRTISYGPTRNEDGSIVPNSAVEYEPLLHRLTKNERTQYDQISDLWSELLKSFEDAEENACQGRSGQRYSQYYSAQQRFFLQLMMAYTLPDLIPAIETDLAEDRSVVLSLFSTGEAQTDRKVRHARARGMELSELDATPREMIVQLIENHFPIYQYVEQTDAVTGNVVRVRVEDEFGNPEINRENHNVRQRLLDKVADLDFPQNPLDALISHFGVENVAEISGRNHRFDKGKYVRRKLNGVPRRELNAHETKLFQDGIKRIAIISGAGSTGISTHADKQAKNQQRRVFYAFQLSWSADQQMQAFGRAHRANQSSAPIIRLALIDLAGQKRLVNAVSKRLAALGALTKGERQSLSSDLFRPEDVTDTFGKSALTKLYHEIQIGTHSELGLTLSTLERMGVLDKEKTSVKDSFSSNVEQFLNRIMVLHVADQNQIFDLFYERYTYAVDAAKKQGLFDFGVEEIRAKDLRRAVEPELLFTDPSSGAKTMLHELTGQVKVKRNSFTVAKADARIGFYRNLRSGKIYAVGEHIDSARTDYPLTAVKHLRRSVEQHELDKKFERVSDTEAKAWWNAEYHKTPSTEARNFHVLSGALIPIYDRVMGSTGIHSLKIARAILANGDSLVGLNLSSSDVPQVKRRLGIGTPLASAPPQEITNLITSGSIIELDNGWRLRRTLISGDKAVELLLSGVPANRDELLGYGFAEEIIHFKRRWFVVLEDAHTVLSELLAHHSAIEELEQ